MKRSQGFTVIELITVIVFLGIVTVVLFAQRANLVATEQDNQRKTAINAMYYNLEEVYYAAHHAYPTTISRENLTAMDPALFTDPNGVTLGSQNADYRYEATNCSGSDCKSYTLRAALTKEAPYIKTSKHS